MRAKIRSLLWTESSNKHFKASLERAGIEAKGRTQYALRHRVNTLLKAEIGHGEKIRAFMGHSSEAMAENYNHPANDCLFASADGMGKIINKLYGQASTSNVCTSLQFALFARKFIKGLSLCLCSLYHISKERHSMSESKADSVDFAVYLYCELQDRDIQATQTKLQKLLYICFGYYLAATGERLLNEMPCAWPYGPVFPGVYEAQAIYNGNLRARAYQTDFDSLKKYDGLIDSVIRHFGHWSAQRLTEWTHQSNMAWDKVRSKVGYKSAAWNTPLELEDIAEDFSGQE